MVLRIVKEVRDIKRFNQILIVLFEEGFDFLISETKLIKRIPVSKRLKKKLKKKFEISHEQRLVNTLERLGPTFIKFGQVLSLRPDLLPPHYIKALEKLQDDVKPIPYTEISKIVKKELGGVKKAFKTFGKKPLASASISQVHKATLKSGQQVAVKIQRPKIKKIMQADIDIMHYCAHLLEKHFPNLRPYEPRRIVEEFEYWTKKELDFTQEAKNAEHFARNFRGSHDIIIPKLYSKQSTPQVLVTEYIEGIPLHDLPALRKKKININRVIENGFNASLVQVFDHGFFHADPHPGNIIVKSNGSLAFIDFGIVGHFDDKIKNQSIDLLYGVVEQDAEQIVDVLSEMGMEPGSDKDELQYEIKELIEPLQYSKINEVRLSEVIEMIMQLSLKYKVRVPMQFVLFGKTLVTLEGLALEYDPRFNVVKRTKPFLEHLLLKRYSPEYQVKHFLHDVRKYKKLFDQFPDKTQKVLERLQSGKISIHLEDTDIKRLSTDIDRSSNRIAYGLVIAGLLVASSFLIQVERGPAVLGIPIVAFCTFVLATMLGFVLLASIIREQY